jgi:hypothetical protein
MSSVGDYFNGLGPSGPKGASGWRSYDERPSSVVEVDNVVVVGAHFIGTTDGGIRVEMEAFTVFRARGSEIEPVEGWHHRPLPIFELVNRYFRATNAEDWDAFGALWTEDARMQAVGGPPRDGPAEIVLAYRRFHDLFHDHVDRVDRMIIAGRAATVMGRFLATNQHGVPIEFDWLDLFELAEDEHRISRVSHWHDRDLVRRLMATTEKAGLRGQRFAGA